MEAALAIVKWLWAVGGTYLLGWLFWQLLGQRLILRGQEVTTRRGTEVREYLFVLQNAERQPLAVPFAVEIDALASDGFLTEPVLRTGEIDAWVSAQPVEVREDATSVRRFVAGRMSGMATWSVMVRTTTACRGVRMRVIGWRPDRTGGTPWSWPPVISSDGLVVTLIAGDRGLCTDITRPGTIWATLATLSAAAGYCSLVWLLTGSIATADVGVAAVLALVGIFSFRAYIQDIEPLPLGCLSSDELPAISPVPAAKQTAPPLVWAPEDPEEIADSSGADDGGEQQ